MTRHRVFFLIFLESAVAYSIYELDLYGTLSVHYSCVLS